MLWTTLHFSRFLDGPGPTKPPLLLNRGGSRLHWTADEDVAVTVAVHVSRGRQGVSGVLQRQLSADGVGGL